MAAVRTSYTIWLLAEGFDNSSCEREGKRLDELPLMLAEDPPVMGREGGHNVVGQLYCPKMGTILGTPVDLPAWIDPRFCPKRPQEMFWIS